MENVLKGVKDKWIPRAEIKEMGDFLLTHPRYLYPLHNFITQTRCVCHLYKKLDLVIEEAVSLGIIERGDVTNKFAALSTRFMEYDLAKSGAARGDLLEYLCYSRGPFIRPQIGVSEIICYRKCIIQNQHKETQCGNHNFDLGFAYASAGILELQECKYRLSNFLDESRATRRKLDYMKCIQQRLSKDYSEAQVVFVSMQFDHRTEEKALKQMGFDFAIFGFEDMMSLIS